MPTELTLDDFDYALPAELIAQHPLAERGASRLLDGSGAWPIDRQFRDLRDLPQLVRAGDLLVFNDTRVVRARLLGEKPTGGAVEALVERVLPPPATAANAGEGAHEVWAHLRASKSPRPGTTLRFGGAPGAGAGSGFEAEVLGRAGPEDALFHLRFPSEPLALLQRFGHVPLPPYITHDDTAADEARYQSVLAARPGAVAAPTASLHFDEAMLEALAARGVERTTVTLHVGAGTFQPVRAERISLHRMHSEWFEVGEAAAQAVTRVRAAGGRIVAVGTTAMRALESAARRSARGIVEPCRGETDLFITPGFEFRVVDRLLTNFHLPKSTLLMLVSAFAGHAHVRSLYRHAIESRYRFFSYGDCMWLARAEGAAPV
ncbi:MAG: tRNA preQ1(34) S-adenosylmethionine ribosyltransferase-isomerase QueA [Burkholderiales bacterium]|nr:tRNA preQ1(34) S-adenosylmethionine ribosyltransferase-isomerase QueA [Burkholderiales bacterium]